MKSNVNKIYFYTFCRMLLFVLPVFSPFLQSQGLSMKEVFEVLAVFNIAMVLFDVPTGYLCDLFGRKRVLMLGSLITAIGYTSLNFAHSYWPLVGVYFVVALGFSLISGADIALIYESMDFLAPEQRHPHRVIANQQFYMVLAEAIAAIVGGMIAEKSIILLLKLNAVSSWIPFFICFSLKEPAFKKLHHLPKLSDFGHFVRNLFLKDKLLRLIFANWVFWGLSTYTAIWILQKNWQERGLELSVFGFLWALCNLSVGVFGHAVDSFEKQYGPPLVLALIGLGPILGYFGMSHHSVAIAIGFSLLFYMSRGLFSVYLRELFNQRITHEFRATGNSLQSFAMRFLFVMVSPWVGFAVDKKGSAYVGNILAVICLVGFFALLVPLVRAISSLPKKTP